MLKILAIIFLFFCSSKAMEFQKDVPQKTTVVTCPHPGEIIELFVTPGQKVEVGDCLCMTDFMKMHIPVHAQSSGIVDVIHFRVGSVVEPGFTLFTILPFPTFVEKKEPQPEPEATKKTNINRFKFCEVPLDMPVLQDQKPEEDQKPAQPEWMVMPPSKSPPSHPEGLHIPTTSNSTSSIPISWPSVHEKPISSMLLERVARLGLPIATTAPASQNLNFSPVSLPIPSNFDISNKISYLALKSAIIPKFSSFSIRDTPAKASSIPRKTWSSFPERSEASSVPERIGGFEVLYVFLLILLLQTPKLFRRLRYPSQINNPFSYTVIYKNRPIFHRAVNRNDPIFLKQKFS